MADSDFSVWIMLVRNRMFCSYCIRLNNKTGLQPVSRPVVQILGFFQKVFNAKKWSQNVFKN